jgi:hypothetical protein
MPPELSRDDAHAGSVKPHPASVKIRSGTELRAR